MTTPASRPRPAEAGTELLVLAHWEAFVPWLLDHCARWPRSARFSLTQRLENRALDVLELLVVARYQPRQRAGSLHQANLLLERMRFLCRVAQARQLMSVGATCLRAMTIGNASPMTCHTTDDRKPIVANSWRRSLWLLFEALREMLPKGGSLGRGRAQRPQNDPSHEAGLPRPDETLVAPGAAPRSLTRTRRPTERGSAHADGARSVRVGG